MKKLLVIFLASIVLTGCYQTATIRDIENAAKICGGLDQVAEILVAFESSEAVICADLSQHRINTSTIQEVTKRTLISN